MAGVWCVAGAARSIGSISVVMVKGKAYGNNPHSEDNVKKKGILGMVSSLSPATEA